MTNENCILLKQNLFKNFGVSLIIFFKINLFLEKVTTPNLGHYQK